MPVTAVFEVLCFCTNLIVWNLTFSHEIRLAWLQSHTHLLWFYIRITAVIIFKRSQISFSIMSALISPNLFKASSQALISVFQQQRFSVYVIVWSRYIMHLTSSDFTLFSCPNCVAERLSLMPDLGHLQDEIMHFKSCSNENCD